MNTELIRCLSAAYDLADSTATKRQVAGLMLQECAPAGNGLLAPAEMSALAKDEKLTAIKLYRERTGASLKDSKDVIEGFMREMACWYRKNTPQ